MTWGEFKRWAEHQGVKDDDIIAYMDWSGDSPKIDRRPDNSVCVWD